ncbi:MAG: Excinuclease ABC C subunit domain protein [Candidatus Kaiserbacteria bacterium GW2011_GWC2_52_8b]|uniref:Excinuclease ABC C subunit domain protein n=1 Tax=Candidatus Kaiserbacteria bacterium GW2011_GWC2_52_8b TaxID=1618676 RepID=A0A0G1XG65_9BACT|nr:MAG: Excinuclease ABC C subunit domain protein [Candidatus Kaiserbacteria bacterium GW2011_GWC2_52_8b]
MTRYNLTRYKLPDAPGVYMFLGSPSRGVSARRGKDILYIGKAASLRDRVRSYFSHDLAEARSPAVVGMVEKATSLSWQETDSVLEALILEANLIKKHQPLFNVEQKDNKSWNYLVITKEEFPRVILVRGRELSSGFLEARSLKLAARYGPYPHGGQLKEALRIVRKIFPFRDRCLPGAGKPCFNRQIKLCPGVCSGEVSKKEYARTVKNLRELFSGNFKGLKRQLAREMKSAARKEDFERAASLCSQIAALEHIRDVSLIKNENRVAGGGPIHENDSRARIEAYDVAHTAGLETVAVMTVIEGGEPEKSAYRKFKIRTAKNDDVAALSEAIERRLSHTEWPLPRVLVIDGGKAQLRAAERILDRVGLAIPVVGVVKNEFHKPKNLIGNQKSIQAYGKDILFANAEAHRFAITFHRARRRKGMVLR